MEKREVKFDEKNSVVVNYAYNMIYQITLVVLPLITSPYLSRVVGPEGLGQYSFSYSIAYYFFQIGMLGVNNYGNRSIARIREDQEKVNYSFSRIFYFQLLVSSVLTISYLVYCLFICKANVYLALAQILYVGSAMFNVNWFFFGLEEFRITVVRKTAIKIITSVCIFVFVKSVNDLLLYAIIVAGAEMLGELYLWYYIPKYVKFKKVKFADVFSGAKDILILFIPVIATSVYRYMDKIMLGSLSNMSNVGQYDYAEKIIMICLGCMTALGTVMMPKMANLIANKKDKEVSRYLVNSMQFAMFMGFAIAFGLASVGNRLALVYFGKNYGDCGMTMVYLAVTVLPIAWANVIRTQFLIPSSKDKEYVSSVIIGAALNFSINFLLIPRLGLMGAIIGTLVAEFSVAIIQTIQVRKELEIKMFVRNSIPFAGIGFVMFIAVKFITLATNDNLTGLLLQMFVGGMVYVGVSAVYCIKTKNNIYHMTVGFVNRKIRKRK